MTQDQILIVAFKVTLAAGEVAAWLWIAVYTYLARWWHNPVGATVTRFAIYIALLYLPSLLSLFLQLNRFDSRLAAWFDCALFAVVAIELFRRIPMWIRLHLKADRTRTYPALAAFCAEVWRRRFRPVWAGEPDTPARDKPT